MALQMTVHFPVSSPFPSPAKAGHPRTFARFKLPPVSHPKLRPLRNRSLTITNAADETGENPETETVSAQQSPTESESRVGELGSEIREAMRQRKEEEGRDGGFWSGVAEEIREIEWPPFGKVLGTTGVVLGVIAGSSVVLLTVNAVLAELSDRVFAGRGVQDFFG
ncbi:preprotein translocase subunit SECE1 [Alnus glutinosa]|uniref:preprotein translocase subunit SECE1 n=1 Tax=Alnus glutinosa TaxID=3517 RepID=UPI002D79C8C4|nr:preprotein translocase subunit SECE1 [Alnus glutinosa]